ncbi:DUF5681 domain-containing protein [Parasphingorhabdus sp.]|uniref:DUF5681 domain-containing protein n=1 Tax=Parasphingorhabdus sp. TaxID=2709688 RepID=UPI003D2C63EC
MSADYEIGFGRPPHYTQFRKGKSGNPSGRPKKVKDSEKPVAGSEADKILRAQLDREISLKGGSGNKAMKVLEAISLAQQKSALAGNSAAQREILKEARLLEEREFLCAQHQLKMDRKNFKDVLKWKSEQKRIWAGVEQGSEPDNPWPHPDDFITDDAKQFWTIRGPVDESDVSSFKRLRFQRDYHLSSLIIEARRDSDPLILTAHLTWAVYNRLLPRRWQVEASDVDSVFVKLLAVPIDKLRRRAEASKRQAELLPSPQLDQKTRRETYQTVNKAMKPLLQRGGYRSVAEFEHHVSQNEK